MSFVFSARLGATAALCLLTGILSGCGGGGGSSSGGSSPSPPAPANTAPVASAANFTTPEDDVLRGTLDARDPEGSALTFTVAAQPVHGILVVTPTTGAFTYTPDPDFHGADEFTFTASDGRLKSAPAKVSIVVTPVDDAFAIRRFEVPAGGEARRLFAVTLQISDPEDIAGIEVTTDGGAAVSDIALRPGGFEFRLPDADEAHPANFRVRVHDAEGTVLEREFTTTLWPVSASGRVTTLIGSPHSPGLHWVITGDGFRANERLMLLEKARSVIDLTLSQPLLEAHNSVWNVHVLVVASAQTGADVPSGGITRDTAFDASFDCGGIGRLLCVDFGKVYAELLPEFQDFDALLVLVNSEQYGGSGGGAGAVVSTNSLADQVILHEMGHSFAWLADEYVDSAIETQGEGTYVEGAFPNITKFTDPADIPWRWWFAHPTDIPTNVGALGIGRFEGGFYRARGLYRPTFDSFMRNTGGTVNAVHSEAWVWRMYQAVPPIIGSAPARGAVTLSLDERRTFGILRAFPRAVQRVRWYLDGQEIVSGRDVEQIVCCKGISGAHVLRVDVTDTTGVIRRPDAEAESRASRTWDLTIDADVSVPRIDLSAAPGAVIPGATSTLTWQVSQASVCVASGGWTGVRGTSGSETTPALSDTTIYRLRCTGAGGTTEEILPVLVAPADEAPAVTLVALADTVAAAEPVQLYWTSTRASSCTASGAWTGTLAAEGREIVDAISATSQYTITCTGPGGSAQASVTVRPRGDAPLLAFTAEPPSVFTGRATLLAWTALSATSCEAFGDWTGPRPVNGSESVFPVAAGTYRLDCVGPEGVASEFVTVTAAGEPPPEESPIELITSEFVELNGRAGHQGLVPVSREPVAGTTPRLRVVLGGDLDADPALSLIDAQGNALSTLTLARQARASASAREYLGDITLPAGAFRVRAQGTDAQGRAYDLTSRLFTPVTFEARLPFGRAPARGGAPMSIPLIVKNHGAAGQFVIDTAVDWGVTLTSPPRQTLTLEEGETRELAVLVEPPPFRLFGTDVSVTMWREGEGAVTNGSALRLRVIEELE